MWHINTHINPITLYNVHVNTTFRFDNPNEFIQMEAKRVHVNVATERMNKFMNEQKKSTKEIELKTTESVNCIMNELKHMNRFIN